MQQWAPEMQADAEIRQLFFPDFLNSLYKAFIFEYYKQCVAVECVAKLELKY